MIHPEQIIFFVLAAATLGSAVMVVTLRNIVHCGVFLVFSFLGVAGIYILLNAEFLFAAQIMIYVGAISVVILFAIMLTEQKRGALSFYFNRQSIFALPLTVAAAVVLTVVLVTSSLSYSRVLRP